MSEITKNRALSVLLIMIGSVFILGCMGHDKGNNERYVFVQDTLQNGLVLVKGVMINGKKEGLWNEYYNDGSLMSISIYTNDELNGPYIFYRENGWVYSIEQYKNGLKEGKWVEYFEYPNSIASIRYYSEGKKVGVWENFDYLGRLMLKVRYGPNEEEEILEDNQLPVPE